jgi:hypothetical protein
MVVRCRVGADVLCVRQRGKRHPVCDVFHVPSVRPLYFPDRFVFLFFPRLQVSDPLLFPVREQHVSRVKEASKVFPYRRTLIAGNPCRTSRPIQPLEARFLGVMFRWWGGIDWCHLSCLVRGGCALRSTMRDKECQMLFRPCLPIPIPSHSHSRLPLVLPLEGAILHPCLPCFCRG